MVILSGFSGAAATAGLRVRRVDGRVVVTRSPAVHELEHGGGDPHVPLGPLERHEVQWRLELLDRDGLGAAEIAQALTVEGEQPSRQVLFRWNDFLGPLIYLNESKLYTISLGLQQYHAERFAEWAYLMAASTLVTLPVIIIFLFTQHTFIEGITLTGIKG